MHQGLIKQGLKPCILQPFEQDVLKQHGYACSTATGDQVCGCVLDAQTFPDEDQKSTKSDKDYEPGVGNDDDKICQRRC